MQQGMIFIYYKFLYRDFKRLIPNKQAGKYCCGQEKNNPVRVKDPDRVILNEIMK